MKPDLVYDVGMNNGDDTGYYLARGYNVVAVEADPALANLGAEKFADAVRSGRLRIVNCAVGAEDGRAQFWICKDNSAWNSFDRAVASRNGLEHYAIDVPVRRFAGVMAEYGVPYYLKIDIEGFDHHCLAAIDPADRPVQVSWEISDIADLFMVRSKGYNAFKCVSQSRFELLELGSRRGQPQQDMAHRLRLRARHLLLKSAAGQALVRRAARRVHGVNEDGRARSRVLRRAQWPGGSWDFVLGSSGPFGDDLGGDWKAAETVAYEYLDFWLHAGQGTNVNEQDWFDVHATTLAADKAPTVGTAMG